ncbi:MAG: hypothetical protein LW750_04265 [Bacteroidetes bacterium]|jgi:hypothetical protein|nr:hypothetical protein [Bacteroidota bacterium]
MKKLFLLSVLLLIEIFGGKAYSQMAWYYVPKKNNEKYFCSVAYGLGTARWYSEMKQTSIYDNQGSSIYSGNFKFRAANSSTFYDVNVLFPTGNVRMGLGMNFEKFYLTTIQLKQNVQTVNSGNLLLYDESFRFDKLYLQCEVPFWPEARSKFSCSAGGYAGFFSFSNVDRINLFGGDALANSMFFGVSTIADFQAFPGFFIFLKPITEYKYFRNPAVDPSGSVHHNIMTYSIMIGLRYDPSVMDEYK